MATIDDLKAGIVAADKAGDVDSARRLAAALNHMQENGQQTYTPPMPKLGLYDSVKEAVTGDLRKTPDTESTPVWTSMPELADFKSAAGWKTGIGTLMSSTPEAVQVIKANYPGVQVRQDEKGNYFLRSSIDGNEYVIPPGFRFGDLPRAGAVIAAYTPAGRATGLLGRAVAGAATQAAIETSQAATGGNFDTSDVALAGAGQAAVPLVLEGLGQATRAGIGQVKNLASKLSGEPPPIADIPLTPPASVPVPDAPAVAPAAPTAPAAPVSVPAPEALPAAGPAEYKVFKPAGQSADVGEYSAGRKIVAETHAGPDGKIEASTVKLENPLKLTYSQLEDLQTKIFGKPLAAADQNATQQFNDFLQKQGHDGVALFDPAVSATVPEEVVKFASKAAPAEAFPGGAIPTSPSAAVAEPAAQAVIAAPRAAAAPQAGMSLEDLAATAKKASGGGWSANSARQTLAEQAAANPKTLDAAKRLGIEDYLQPDHVTTNQAYRELAQAVKSVPGSAAKAQEVAGLEAVANRADKLVTDIGGTNDLSRLDSGIKSEMQSAHTELEQRANRLYQQLRDQVPASTPAPATSTLDFLKQRVKDLGDARYLSPMERDALNKLAPKGAAGRGGKGAVTQPTYALLDDVRRDVGSAAQGRGAFKDADTGLAKKLYELLTDDQSKVLDGLGHKDLHDLAKAAVRTRKGLEDDMAALYGKNMDGSIVGKLGTAVKGLQKGDTAGFIKLLKATPENMRQQLTASGLNSAFNRNLRSGQISFTSYANWYEGLLRNKQAYAALMSNLPKGARKQLSDLYRVSNGISKAQKEFIATGRINAVRDVIRDADTLTGKIYEVAKQARLGAAAEAITTPMGLPGIGMTYGIASALAKAKTPAMKAADELISSPEFINAVKQTPMGGAAERVATKKLAESAAFTRFWRSARQPNELNAKQKWILQALQAGRNQESK